MPRRVELGFEGGSILGITLPDEAATAFAGGLGNGGGWKELDAEEGTYYVNLDELVYVRLAPGEAAKIGFGNR